MPSRKILSVDRIARELEEARKFLRRVRLELKLTELDIAEDRETLRQSRALLDRLIAEGKWLPLRTKL